ncbi:endonuclease MutS2 isoform X1 [Senna tora]|uniref:Endonuclease MutS2 isoform X1 n=1 Tax=Senna tora TaxID=362788 RepID=A0A834WAW9_9FABA|nr:endonuclease MutS2 isoform X1 [Senna tora]
MFSCTAISVATTLSTFPITLNIRKFNHRLAFFRHSFVASSSSSSIHYDSLRVLEWDKLCDLVASFASTSLGHEALKVRLSLSLLPCVTVSLCLPCWRVVTVDGVGPAVVSESNVRGEFETSE